MTASAPTPVTPASDRPLIDVDAILQLHQDDRSARSIARRLGLSRGLVDDILRHARQDRRPLDTPVTFSPSRPSAASRPAPSPRPSDADRALALRQAGHTHRQIARALGCSRDRVGRLITTAAARWRDPHKRRHEAAILRLTGEILAGPPKGAAVVLTGPELLAHIDALKDLATRLLVVERDSAIFGQIVESLTEPPPLPLEIYLDDFWHVAEQSRGPLAFLDFDGMGVLPPDLPTHLAALAPRLTDPAVARLTFCLDARGGHQQIRRATTALNGIPTRTLTALTVTVTPPSRGHRRMATLVATLRPAAPPADTSRPSPAGPEAATPSPTSPPSADVPPSAASLASASPALPQDLRDTILARPSVPASLLAQQLGLTPQQVAGYRAAATVRARRTPVISTRDDV